MNRRYLGIIRIGPEPIAGLGKHLMERSRALGLNVMYDDDRVIVATGQTSPVHIDRHGIILGSLFERTETGAVKRIEATEQQRIRSSCGDRLIKRYWGPYVAVLHDPYECSVDIVRAPLGELPCYFTTIPNAIIISSDVETLVACGAFLPMVDWGEVTRQLFLPDLRNSDTCLSGLREVAGGERLRVGRNRIVSDTLWSPWEFVGRDASGGDASEAAIRLRAAARHSVAARASEYDKVVLMLSGGLDSSIVAACLAEQGLPFHCLTLATTDAIGDERDYARLVCDTLGADLTEAFRDVSRIDIGKSGARNLPRPSVRSFLQESHRWAEITARATGGNVIFNGGGGDNVFCALQSAGPAADRLRTTGFDRKFLSTAQDISKLAPASLWAVTSDAVKRAWLGKPALRVTRDCSLLAPPMVASAKMGELHPWLKLPQFALPGKAAHIRLLTYAQNFVEGTDPHAALPSVSPLLSQPLVETCIAIPSWCWFEEGHNRAVARRAFAADLPDAVIERRSKGTPDSFVAQIFETYRASIREMLVGGELDRQQVIDLPAVLSVLDDPRPAHGAAFRRILQFADVEAWARSWR